MKQKAVLLWVLLIVMAVMVYQSIAKFSQPMRNEIAYGVFREHVRKGYVEGVQIKSEKILGQYKTEIKDSNEEFATLKGKSFFTYWVGTGDELTRFLEASGVSHFKAVNEEGSGFWQYIAGQAFIMVLVTAVMIFFLMKAMQAGSGKAFNFGKSRAKLQNEQLPKLTFADVAGIDESKEELQEIIDFLKDPKKFTKLGGRIPKGVLLVGSPGTGKTLLAKAISGEAGVPFFSISGSDFVEMFVGVGASRVRDLFEQAKKSAPCIVFIDEIDAVGRHRGAGLGGGHDEREQTLNQLLVEMDGFEFNEGVIIIAATNRPDVLDPALLRPGRFDRHVIVPKPDVRGRIGILKVHTKKIPLEKNVDFEILAKGTSGFTGADLENTVNEAALLAARHNKVAVGMDDFEKAKDKIMLGKERKTMVISDEEKRITSYHEAGHTLVASKIPGADPVHKVTIIPRGMALGLTHQMPSEDKYTLNQENAETLISILMGGRVAEEIVFGKKTNGAGNDIERATELARKMVCEWGMSERLGPLAFGHKEHEIFLAKDISYKPNYSEKTAQLIDEEVQAIIYRNYKRALRIIDENRSALDRLAEALLQFETLEADEVLSLIDAKISVSDLRKKIPESARKKESAEKESVLGRVDLSPKPVLG